MLNWRQTREPIPIWILTCHIYPEFNDERVDNTADDGDEIKSIPRIFEKILYEEECVGPKEEEKDVREREREKNRTSELVVIMRMAGINRRRAEQRVGERKR